MSDLSFLLFLPAGLFGYVGVDCIRKRRCVWPATGRGADRVYEGAAARRIGLGLILLSVVWVSFIAFALWQGERRMADRPCREAVERNAQQPSREAKAAVQRSCSAW